MTQSAQIPVSAQVSKTVLSLIQALLKTGYYQPGHPETAKAREGLYEAVTDLFQNRHEITFMSNVRDEQPEVLVGGVAHDYMAMRRVMARNMADMFLPKMVDFFRRKRLSSFTLRHGISRYEFDTFLDIMTRSGWLEDQQVDVRERMTRALVEREILNVSVVFIDDLIGQARKLPWRVEATLSRLKRDLNMLPLYQHVDTKKIQEVRRQVFEEIVRPLKDAILVCELLVNVDLIIMTLHDFDRDSFLYTLIDHLDPAIVPQTCHLVTKELANIHEDLEKKPDEDSLKNREHEVRWVARRLAEGLLEDEQVDASLFHSLVRHKVFVYEEIPEALREEISALQALGTLLENTQNFFREIEESKTPEMLQRKLWRLLELVPELVRHGHDSTTRDVIGFAQRYGATFALSNRPHVVDRLRQAMAERAIEENREGVDEMLKGLKLLEQTGLEILADLADHENRSVRRLGLEALAERGQSAVPVCFAALEKKEGWHFLRNVLVLFGRIKAGGPKVEKLFRRCMTHPEAHVRSEAVKCLAHLCGPDAEEPILAMLDDTDGEVRKSAVGALAVTGIRLPETLTSVVSILSRTGKGGEAMALQVVMTLNKLRPEPFEDPAVEEALIELVKPKGFLGIGAGKETALSGPLQEGVVRALGYVGTQRCLKNLGKLEKGASPGLRKALKTSQASIRSRVG